MIVLKFLAALLILCAVFVALCIAFGWWFSVPNNGKVYSNLEPTNRGDGNFWRWQWERRKLPPWNPYTRPIEKLHLPTRIDGKALRATFVNHATVLLQTQGLNVLTDPIWSQRASPFSWIGPSRKHPPGVAFEKLPFIDWVLVSHNHYDHMDLPTLRRLQETFAPKFIVTAGNGAFLKSRPGMRNAVVEELGWWESRTLAPGVELWCVPAKHFSSRGLFDRNKTVWAGFVMKTPDGGIYFAGDTGFGGHFAEIRKRLGPPRFSLIPIGAYEPRWIMQPVHMNPIEAVAAHEELQSAHSMGIHFRAFRLTDEMSEDPERALQAELEKRGIALSAFTAPHPGQSFEIP